MVFLFNKTITNILPNYIHHETVNDKNCILNDKNPQVFHKVNYLQKQLKNIIERSQEKYYLRISKKLMDLMASPKTYWSILKTLLNNKKFLKENKYVTDFKNNNNNNNNNNNTKKTELFDCFFAEQCSIIDNSSEIPLVFAKKQTSLSQQSLSLAMILQH